MQTTLLTEEPLRESIHRMDKRELNKLMRTLIADAEASASEILLLTTPQEIIEVSEGLGVPLTTKEEQLQEMREIIQEYQQEYGSKEHLKELAKTNPHLSIILETWIHYEELLRKEGRL
ncbi:hypothetical protein SAMN05216170_2312 [Thermococcus thioreducens]|uniref:Uncharacterized protein n=2 Tax=Thermococcus thioreducens TaxID=277988 RepID=A0A1I0Q9L6_9EURY|nr:hypothetical protein SAMN05216170_2312 [Thermococcus thioreducens]